MTVDISEYGACVVYVIHPDGERHYYGAFANGEEATEWMNHQYEHGQFTGSFFVIRLRTPDRVRSHHDWYCPERLLTDDEFNAEYPYPNPNNNNN